MDTTDLEHDEPGLTIRTLRASDLPRLARIDQAWLGRNRSKYLEDKLQRALSAGVQISLGAESDGQLVGAMLGAVHYGEFGLPEPVAVLDTILVDKAWTGKHIGAKMMEQLVKNLRGLRIERLRTEVAWTEMSLLGFLAHEGFVPTPRLVLEKVIE